MKWINSFMFIYFFILKMLFCLVVTEKMINCFKCLINLSILKSDLSPVSCFNYDLIDDKLVNIWFLY